MNKKFKIIFILFSIFNVGCEANKKNQNNTVQNKCYMCGDYHLFICKKFTLKPTGSPTLIPTLYDCDSFSMGHLFKIEWPTNIIEVNCNNDK